MLKTSKYIVGIGAVSAVFFIGFQNCSRASYTLDGAAVSFKTEGTSSPTTTTSSTTTSSSTSGTSGTSGTPAGGNDGVSVPTPTPSPTPITDPTPQTPTPTPSGSSTGGTSGGTSGSGGSGTGSDGTGLVECELGSPSTKVILSKTFLGDHSNSSSTRVCMSEYACLTLMNAYAVDRNCELTPGAPVSQNATGQCTDIFPGSNGTCHNAQILTDEQVSNILTNMANQK